MSNPDLSFLNDIEDDSLGRPDEYRFQTDPRVLTNVLTGALVVIIGLELTAIAFDVQLLRQINAGLNFGEAYLFNDTYQSPIGFARIVAYLIGAILFLKWKVRAYANARHFGARRMKYDSNLAAFYYFVPILNFFRPYQVMREIWRVSQDPENWRSVPGTALIGWWWLFWLLDRNIGFVAREESSAWRLPELETSAFWWILANSLSIVTCTLAIILTRSIVRSQVHLIENGRHDRIEDDTDLGDEFAEYK